MEKKYRRLTNEIMFPDILDGEGDIIPIIADGDDVDLEDVVVPDAIPILSLRNTVLFPGVVLPISIGRPKSIQLIKDAYRNDKIVGTVAQKDPDIENPNFEDLHKIGTIGQIVKLWKCLMAQQQQLYKVESVWCLKILSPMIHIL